MTVGELIEQLRQCPQDMPVVVNGMEDGFDDVVVSPTRERCILDARNTDLYLGRHARCAPDDLAATTVVLLDSR